MTRIGLEVDLGTELEGQQAGDVVRRLLPELMPILRRRLRRGDRVDVFVRDSRANPDYIETEEIIAGRR